MKVHTDPLSKALSLATPGLDYPGCYGEYTKDNVDEEPYGMVRFRSDNAQYRWYYDNNVGEALPYTSPHTGITYDKGGFFKNLPYDQNVMESAVAELEANEFTDKKTRGVIVTWFLFNVNFNMFCMTRVLFEFTPGGLILPSVQTNLFRMDTYGEPNWQFR